MTVAVAVGALLRLLWPRVERQRVRHVVNVIAHPRADAAAVAVLAIAVLTIIVVVETTIALAGNGRSRSVRVALVSVSTLAVPHHRHATLRLRLLWLQAAAAGGGGGAEAVRGNPNSDSDPLRRHIEPALRLLVVLAAFLARELQLVDGGVTQHVESVVAVVVAEDARNSLPTRHGRVRRARG